VLKPRDKRLKVFRSGKWPKLFRQVASGIGNEWPPTRRKSKQRGGERKECTSLTFFNFGMGKNMLNLSIDTANAAFEDYGLEVEVARILKAAADRILNGDTDFNLRDINGNTVGRVCLTKD
jgi:hypothetical protein